MMCSTNADSCAQGACRCGSGPACSPGTRCLAGACFCDPLTCSTGCCSGGSCQARTFATCGTGGASCVACGSNADTCSLTGVCSCGTQAACSAGNVCLAGACVSPSQDWTTRALSPPQLYAGAAVWDAARARLIWFGGRGLGTRVAETWSLGPAGWTLLTPTTSPPARSGHDMAWDAARQRIVLFGGFPDSAVRLGDTWEWDGATWILRTPTTSPSPRSGHRMAWDPVRQVVVLFGGRIDGPTSSSYQGDTWTWNGSDWIQAATVGPSAREGVSLAWDPGLSGGRLVLFGGIGTSGNRADTHTWDGTAWSAVTTTLAPPGRVFHDMVYSPPLGKVLLFGGSTGASAVATYFNDTWVFDRTTWTQLAPPTPPAARNGHGLEWDPVRMKVQLISGFNGTAVVGTQHEY